MNVFPSLQSSKLKALEIYNTICVVCFCCVHVEGNSCADRLASLAFVLKELQDR